MILALLFAVALAAPPADAPQSPQERMDALQQVYDTSCGNRGYGEYDDVCNSIRDQIKEAAKELAREARRPRKAAALPPKGTPPPSAKGVPPSPSAYSAAPTTPVSPTPPRP